MIVSNAPHNILCRILSMKTAATARYRNMNGVHVLQLYRSRWAWNVIRTDDVRRPAIPFSMPLERKVLTVDRTEDNLDKQDAGALPTRIYHTKFSVAVNQVLEETLRAIFTAAKQKILLCLPLRQATLRGPRLLPLPRPLRRPRLHRRHWQQPQPTSRAMASSMVTTAARYVIFFVDCSFWTR